MAGSNKCEPGLLPSEKRGKLPEGADSSNVIFVPLKKIVCMSTTHLAMISALHEENTIAGVSGTDFIYSPALNSRVDKGLIMDVGYEANLNKELILKIKPDLIWGNDIWNRK